ncbi:MAG: LysM peptidoglycan-binding domain-containing protein, partial [Chloroflexota bacterium]
TSCPGYHLNPAEIRTRIEALDNETPTPPTDTPIPATVDPGEHVLLLPDTDRYLQSSLAYIWKFEPDVSFAISEAKGQWKYMSVVGSPDIVPDSQLDALRSGGALLVQRVAGDPEVVQTTLDELVKQDLRFLVIDDSEPSPPEEPWRTYTIQPGDTLSRVAQQMYGQAHLWRVIFEANRDTLSDPGRIRPGQVLKIPPNPDA